MHLILFWTITKKLHHRRFFFITLGSTNLLDKWNKKMTVIVTLTGRYSFARYICFTLGKWDVIEEMNRTEHTMG